MTIQTTTNVSTLKFNKLTKAQYQSATKSNTEFYLTDDESLTSSDVANVALTGSYNDLLNKPTQLGTYVVFKDWNYTETQEDSGGTSDSGMELV